LKGVDANMIV